MANDTMTITLSGEILLANYDRLLRDFRQLVESLTAEVAAGTRIKWLIDDLSAGSATTVVRGLPQQSSELDKVERIVKAYQEVGKALEHRTPIPFSPRVQKPALRLVDMIDHDIDAIIFQTAEGDSVIRKVPAQVTALLPTAYGAVEGRVQTLTSRGGLRFTLFDSLHDKPVSCYLEEGKEDVMRNAWGRLAIVEGLVHRDPETGRPISVRHVSKVTLLPESTLSNYRNARNALPARPGDKLPEVKIRRLRDAG